MSQIYHAHFQGAFFFLVQTEEGDLFKVTIDHEDEEVQALKIKYFDTVPVSSSLTILKSGFLFVAAEMGNQSVLAYQNLEYEASWVSASRSTNIDSFDYLTYLLAIFINSKNWAMMMTKPSFHQNNTPRMAPAVNHYRLLFLSHGRYKTWCYQTSSIPLRPSSMPSLRTC